MDEKMRLTVHSLPNGIYIKKEGKKRWENIISVVLNGSYSG